MFWSSNKAALKTQHTNPCLIPAPNNLSNDFYKGLTPPDLIDIAVCNKLLYDGVRQAGVMFHMIGALSQYGKMGAVCIGETVDEARALFCKKD